MQFRISEPKPDYDKISKYSHLMIQSLKNLQRSRRLSPRVFLNEYEKEKLDQLVDIYEEERIEANEPRKVKFKLLSKERIETYSVSIKEITDVNVWQMSVDCWSHITLLLNREIEQLKPLVDEIMVDGKRIK